MSEPPFAARRPVNKLRLLGGILLGLALFFVVGVFAVMTITSVMGEDVGLLISAAATFGLLWWIYTLLRERDRSLALGLLVGVGCALLLFGTCLALLMNTSFH